MPSSSPSTRPSKRPWDNVVEGERDKWQRMIRRKDDKERAIVSEKGFDDFSGDAPKSNDSWSLSSPVAGKLSNLDTVFTSDENYLFLGLESSVQIYSVATGRLFRSLYLGPGQVLIGYKLSPEKEIYLLTFVLSGSITLWDWLSGTQIFHLDTACKTLSADCFQDDSNNSHLTLLCLRDQNERGREIVTTPIEKTHHETVIFQTTRPICYLKSAEKGRVVIAHSDHSLFLGTRKVGSQYVWKEITLPLIITSVDIRQHAVSHDMGRQALDLVLGGKEGSILIYNDIFDSFDQTGKVTGPRRLHWHRGPVSVVRWSKDGNYLLSGGHESVIVLWQLDSGRKQFLPHLSSPICNIVVSPCGSTYVVKLADNCTVMLSARELRPFATITGLQILPQTLKSRTAAVLHPQNPDQILTAVPSTHDSDINSSKSVLQTYDLRTSNHISRQALARTNATVLSISPEGSRVTAPDISHLSVSSDGKWMATIDTWRPSLRDVEAMHKRLMPDIYLKFWRWNHFSSLWELITRIEEPHSSNQGSVSILHLCSRPGSQEFATIGTDVLLRFWCPVARQRAGLKPDENSGRPLETWKCRSTLDLRGYVDGQCSASMGFSQDGSVLAVCLQSDPSTYGLTVLIDVQNCVVRCSKDGVYAGAPCAAMFLGNSLIVSSDQSISVWDIVDDLIKTADNHTASCIDASPLLAVNPWTQTFAVATKPIDVASKKLRKNRCFAHVFDVRSLSIISRVSLQHHPIALLSGPNTSDYTIIDATTNVQRLQCKHTVSQTTQSHELSVQLNSGLARIFGQMNASHDQSPNQTLAAISGGDSLISINPELGSVFGDAPPFALPSANVLFRNIVHTFDLAS